VCPEWDLETIIGKAAEYRYDGVELGAVKGEPYLPAVPEIAADPDGVKRRFANAGLELVCLSTAVSLEPWDAREVAACRERIIEFVRLAERLACPFVRVPIGSVPRGDNRHRTLARIVSLLRELAAEAGRRRVSFVIENGGDFPGSDDLWFVVDNVDHPSVAACWNPCPAMTRLERPTTSIPRLGRRLKLVRICDGKFDQRGAFEDYRLPGEGDVELQRMVEFLRGIIYQGFLMFDWPRALMPGLPDAEHALPAAHARMREWIDTTTDVLTAYKGDKNPVYLDLPGVEVPPPKPPKEAKAKSG
jgi:sugar phosphate isomerase/epimerase